MKPVYQSPIIERFLLAHWWRPTRSWLSWLLLPLAALYGGLMLARRWRYVRNPQKTPALPVPVVVVGNLVVGGAGKTPTVIAVVHALQAAGWHPGVLSRGYGRDDRNSSAKAAASPGQQVLPNSEAAEVGDEPLLISRRCDVPVWVGRQRALLAAALCAQHPQVDVLVSDDGLQHHALARCAELVVFDQRGAGNACLLPAGPLREPLSSQPLRPGIWRRVLYLAPAPSTALPGYCAQRQLQQAWPLAAWWANQAQAAVPLHSLAGQSWLAAAGMAAPQKFFGLLQDAGLHIQPLPLSDHHDFSAGLPWPSDCQRVLVTEKDAVKLKPEKMGATQVWVVPLDLALPVELVDQLLLTLQTQH